MSDAIISTLWGFLGGAAAWFVTNFLARPLVKLHELRFASHRAILDCANITTHPQDADRATKTTANLRSLAIDCDAWAELSLAPLPLIARRLGYDLPLARSGLMGLSNSFQKKDGEAIIHRVRAQRALMLPVDKSDAEFVLRANPLGNGRI